MAIKSLTPEQQQTIVNLYSTHNVQIKKLAKQFNRSERTIGRVLAEAGLLMPVERLQTEAAYVMQMLKHFRITVDELQTILSNREEARALHANVKPSYTRPALFCNF